MLSFATKSSLSFYLVCEKIDLPYGNEAIGHLFLDMFFISQNIGVSPFNLWGGIVNERKTSSAEPSRRAWNPQRGFGTGPSPLVAKHQNPAGCPATSSLSSPR
jgi:hypothetical protein